MNPSSFTDSNLTVNDEFLEWLIEPKWNGAGALTDFGCYGANLATWLLNGERPESVFAMTATNKPDIYPLVDDEATIISLASQLEKAQSWSQQRPQGFS